MAAFFKYPDSYMVFTLYKVSISETCKRFFKPQLTKWRQHAII